MSWRCPTESVEPRSLTLAPTPSGRDSMKSQADFADGVFYGGAIDVRRAKANVGFDGAAEQEGILQDDAEEAAEVLKVDFADVDSVEQDLTALNIIEAKQERDKRGLAGAGVSDDG